MSVIVCYQRCWSCTFGDHFSPPKPHTWMDDEDIEAGNHDVSLSTNSAGWDALAASHPCDCTCAKAGGAS